MCRASKIFEKNPTKPRFITKMEGGLDFLISRQITHDELYDGSLDTPLWRSLLCPALLWRDVCDDALPSMASHRFYE